MEHLPEFIMNHYLLCAAFGGALIMVLLNEWQQQLAGATSIEPAQVVTLINRQNAVILDIRNKDQFNAGHIITAKLTNETNIDILKKYKLKNIITVCDNGIKSQAFSNRLKKEGFEKVSVLNGGVKAWKEASLPIEQTHAKKKSK